MQGVWGDCGGNFGELLNFNVFYCVTEDILLTGDSRFWGECERIYFGMLCMAIFPRVEFFIKCKKKE